MKTSDQTYFEADNVIIDRITFVFIFLIYFITYAQSQSPAL